MPEFFSTRRIFIWIGLAAALRAAYMGFFELLPEEAYYWQYAQHLSPGYIDHPPMVGLTIWFFERLFGTNEFAMRFGALLWCCAAAPAVWKLTVALYDRKAAACAVLLFAFLPYSFGSGLIITPDSPLVFFWAWGLWFAYLALGQNRQSAWWGLGACLGLGMLSKYSIVLFGPSIILYMLIDREARRWFLKKEPYLCALLALLLFSPVIYWNLTNDWASFAFQGTQRLAAEPDFYLFDYLWHVAALLTPAGLLALGGLFSGQSLETQAGARRFMLCFTLPALLLFMFFSISHQVKINWAGPVLLGLLPWLGTSVVKTTGGFERFTSALWGYSIPVLFLAYWLALHFVSFGLPFIPYTPKMYKILAWSDLARQVSEIKSSLSSVSSSPVTVTGLDKHYMASELGFYLNKARKSGEAKIRTAGRSLFAQPSLMYRFWSDPKDFSGHTLLMLSRTPGDLSDELLRPCFENLGALGEIITKRKGFETGRFYYRTGHAYKNCSAAAQRE